MEKYNIILGERPTEQDLRFAVELAHLIGFFSISLQFPVTKEYGAPLDENTKYFYFGQNPPTQKNIIPVCPGPDPATYWITLSRRYFSRSSRAVNRPKDYVAATENIPECCTLPVVSAGLEYLFENGWILQDHNRDGLPDAVNCRFYFSSPITTSLCKAACDIAARFGMETTAVQYPLVTPRRELDTNLLILSDEDVTPSVTLEQHTPKIILFLRGHGRQLEQFSSWLAGTYGPNKDNISPLGALSHLRNALSIRNEDGQAAWIHAHGASQALLYAGADLSRFQSRWPDTEFHSYNDSYLEKTQDFILSSELDTARNILVEQVYPRLSKGDQVVLRGALGQDRAEREQFLAEYRQSLAACGATDHHSCIACAFKPGLSWLEEDFAPRAAASADLASILIRFNPYHRTAVTYDEDRFDWSELDQSIEKPPRWLQDLYPVDELMAQVTGLPTDSIQFEAYSSDSDATYEALAFDKSGNCFLRDSWTVYTHARPYLDAMPELGPTLVTTGFLQVLVNGSILLDTRILTDYEQIWDIFQTSILPWLQEKATERAYAPSLQPFFSKLEVEVGIGGPERKLQFRNDHISLGEKLADSIHQAGRSLFLHYGYQHSGQPLDAPGLILPIVHVRSGRPTLQARLYMTYGKTPSFSDKWNADCHCTVIQAGVTGLELQIEADMPQESIPLVRSLMQLIEEGFSGLAAAFQPFERLSIAVPDTIVSASLPRPESNEKYLCIDQIDLMPDRLIGYDQYLEVMLQLRRVPGLHVYPIARSFEGRTVYAIELRRADTGYVSRVKRLQYLPTVLINGRHHANEVSATNAIFSFLQELLTDSRYEELKDELNLILLPMENVDGAALHYQVQKEHPDWQHRVCYATPSGADLMPYYFRKDCIHTEANAFTTIAEQMLPDAFIDLHGVPHHDLPQQFEPLSGYKGLWLPRSPLCAFYFHIDDAQYASNLLLSQAWKEAVNRQFADWPEFAAQFATYNRRFEKYSWGGTESCYPTEQTSAMLNYWISSPYTPHHPYPTVNRPWVFSVMFTAEAADETAHGDWLRFCAKTHLEHLRAAIDLMRHTNLVMEETTTLTNTFAEVSYVRHRPVLPPNTETACQTS